MKCSQRHMTHNNYRQGTAARSCCRSLGTVQLGNSTHTRLIIVHCIFVSVTAAIESTDSKAGLCHELYSIFFPQVNVSSTCGTTQFWVLCRLPCCSDIGRHTANKQMRIGPMLNSVKAEQCSARVTNCTLCSASRPCAETCPAS